MSDPRSPRFIQFPVADSVDDREAARAALLRRPASAAPKYFYDRRGSELFEEITRLPEYYLTRAERLLLEQWMPHLIRSLGSRTLVELGAGSAEKSRIILNAMRAAGTAELYVPIDVSVAFLRETAEQIRAEYPGLTVTPGVADISEELNVPRRLTALSGLALRPEGMPSGTPCSRRTQPGRA